MATQPTAPDKLEAIDALIKRCEKADGPDRELDEAIEFRVLPRGYAMPGASLPYSSSLDAALVLVPDEFKRPAAFTVERSRNFGCTALVWHNSEFNCFVRGKGKTPALALCAAALAALAKSEVR